MKFKTTDDILCVLDSLLNQKVQQFDAIEKNIEHQESGEFQKFSSDKTHGDVSASILQQQGLSVKNRRL